ncbi:MAG: tol-pal system protein YbgF [Gammaproteobacteria bacterium]
MKPKTLLLLFTMSGISMPSCALPPVVNNQGYANPPPESAAAPKPPPNSALVEMMNRLEQLQNEVRQLTGKVEELSYQNSELKKRLGTLYSDFDERIQSVENRLGGSSPTNTEYPSDRDAPETPPSEQTGADPSDSGKDAESGPVDNQDQPTQSTTDSAPAQKPDPVPEHENQEYRQAYDALRNGRTAQSIEAFNAFLNKYPDSRLAGEAQYWLGEAHRVHQDSSAARAAFNKVIDQHPDSSKVPDALLKLGYIEFDLNNGVKAREYLARVIREFPKSTAARLAEKKLALLENAAP